MNQAVLILITILAVWKIRDIIFPEETKLGKQLVEKIIEVKLLKAFYKEFIFTLIKKDSVTMPKVDKWISTEYISWLKQKSKTDELSDIINGKE